MYIWFCWWRWKYVIIRCLKIELTVLTYADSHIIPNSPQLNVTALMWLFKKLLLSFTSQRVWLYFYSLYYHAHNDYYTQLFFIWHKGWLWRKKRSENLMMEHSSSSPARPPQRMQPHHLQKVTSATTECYKHFISNQNIYPKV